MNATVLFWCGYKIQIQIFNFQISPGLTQPVSQVASTTKLYVAIDPIWNGGRGKKCPPPPSFSFLKIFKTKKGMTLPFYDF